MAKLNVNISAVQGAYHTTIKNGSMWEYSDDDN